MIRNKCFVTIPVVKSSGLVLKTKGVRIVCLLLYIDYRDITVNSVGEISENELLFSFAKRS